MVRICLTAVLLWLSGVQSGLADQELIAARADQAPVIDGKATDALWSHAPEIITHDPVAGIDIHLKAAYSEDQIFFLVSFPDATENRVHKMLVWDEKSKKYLPGPKREDTFVFKWSMDPLPAPLALPAGAPHRADIWYWKAARTDHAGRADDKLQILSDIYLPGVQTIIADNGQTYYLKRKADAGIGAYKQVTPGNYKGDEIEGLLPQTPSGSRADIRAKGVWTDGRWTLEFARPLDTGHTDDQPFDPAYSYRFGVSRYEIAGRERNPAIEIPDYGAGDVGEELSLRFTH